MDIDPELREQTALRHVTEHLAEDYADAAPPEQIEDAVEEKKEAYADAPVRDFVPILVERDVRDDLEESS